MRNKVEYTWKHLAMAQSAVYKGEKTNKKKIYKYK